MTSASELFYNRRFRVGRTSDGLDSPPTGADLFSRGHSFYYRRSRRRSDFDDCDPLRRSSDVRQLSHRASQSQLEHGTLRFDDGTTQINATNNLNLETPSRATSRTEFRRNDRLPGAVLLARERLLQRLRGLSVSESRQQRRMPMPALAEHLDWDAETLIGWLARATPSTDQNFLIGIQTQKPTKPHGLTQKALDCLHLEVFNKTGASQEDCSICLESFENEDKLVRLPCSHRFHSACLDPWVRTCGDCPYCRKGITTAEGNERT